jgi:hypothetical protein
MDVASEIVGHVAVYVGDGVIYQVFQDGVSHLAMHSDFEKYTHKIYTHPLIEQALRP